MTQRLGNGKKIREMQLFSESRFHILVLDDFFDIKDGVLHFYM